MKYWTVVCLFLTVGKSLADDCSSGHHPKAKAECFLIQTLRAGKNDVLTSQVTELKAQGLKATGEVGSTFLGGSCSSPSKCTWRYLVSADFSTSTQFKSVVAIVSASNSNEPTGLIKVMSSDDLK